MTLTHRFHFIKIAFKKKEKKKDLKSFLGIDGQNLTSKLCFNHILHSTHSTNAIIFVHMNLLQCRKLWHSAPCW